MRLICGKANTKTERQTSSKTLRFYGSEFVFTKRNTQQQRSKIMRRVRECKERREEKKNAAIAAAVALAKAHAHNFINGTRMAKEQSIYFLIIRISIWDVWSRCTFHHQVVLSLADCLAAWMTGWLAGCFGSLVGWSLAPLVHILYYYFFFVIVVVCFDCSGLYQRSCRFVLVLICINYARRRAPNKF